MINYIKATLLSKIFLILFGLFLIISSSNATIIEINSPKINNITDQGYIDITVQEAWELLSNTSNGVQYPIDVRTFEEWIYERINTPYPEFSRLITLSDLQTINGINDFKSTYTNKEVIIYCKSGGRSASASQYLVLNEFNGTIYNMLGGITSWKQAGLPIKNNNQIPNKPEIILNSSRFFTNITCFFSVRANDPDDDVIRYGWDWNGDDIIDEWTDYFKSGHTSNISYKWTNLGDYSIKIFAEDIVGEQSEDNTIISITVENLNPNKPEISGTNLGKNGKTYSYNISSFDPNGDNVYYWIQWHNNFTDSYWEGPYSSNEIIIKNYSWINEGKYTIKVKSKDIHGDESEWTNYEVTMPNNKFDLIKKILVNRNIKLYGSLYFIFKFFIINESR